VTDNVFDTIATMQVYRPRCTDISDTAMKFADYVLENDIAVDFKFPPILWAKPPDLLFPYTNNGAESSDRHLNAEFYVRHPNIYVFVDVLKRFSKQRYVSTYSMS